MTGNIRKVSSSPNTDDFPFTNSSSFTIDKNDVTPGDLIDKYIYWSGRGLNKVGIRWQEANDYCMINEDGTNWYRLVTELGVNGVAGSDTEWYLGKNNDSDAQIQRIYFGGDGDAYIENDASGVFYVKNTNGTKSLLGINGLNLTASRAIVTDGSSNLAASATTAVEIGYLSGVTSSIQDQLDAKITTGSLDFSDISATTPNRVVVTDGSGFISASSTTIVQLGYISGATGTSGTSSTNIVFSKSPVFDTGITIRGADASTSAVLNFIKPLSANVVALSADTSSSYTFTLPAGGGTNHYLLETNGSGTTSWVQPKLSAFAETTSSELAGVISDETGTGSLVFSNSPTFVDDITIGGVGVATGTLKLSGTTSGTISITTAAEAGTWTLTLPANDGDANQFLQTDGSGNTVWASPAGAGTVTNSENLADNLIVRGTGTTGVSSSLLTLNDAGSLVFPTAQGIFTGTTAADTLLIGAYDVDGTAYTTFVTLTAGDTPTCVLADTVKIGTLTGVLRADSGAISVDADVTDLVSASSDTVAGKIEIATVAETNGGSDNTRAVSPDAFAGSNFGIRYITFHLNGTAVLTTSEKCYKRIPSSFNGMNLVSVTGGVGTGASGASSSGLPTFTVKNVTDNQQMLSTSLTIDENQYTSATATTPVVIDTTKDDVVTDDLIEVAVTTSGTGVTYASVTLGFQLP